MELEQEDRGTQKLLISSQLFYKLTLSQNWKSFMFKKLTNTRLLVFKYKELLNWQEENNNCIRLDKVYIQDTTGKSII